MELNESIFIAISFLLIGKMYFSIRNIFLSLRFISFDSIKNQSIRQKRLFIIIPLLREKGRIHECYERFKTWLRYSDNAYLIFITTEREVMEHGLSYERNTIYLLDLLMNSEKDFRDRIKKIHFPTFNKTLGEQLNYGIIAAENYYNFNKHDYVILYNADSKPDKMTLRHIINCMADNVLVAQQSALFLKNFGILARNSKIIPMVDSIYQSRWTLQHEIPRYIRSMSNAKLLNIRGLSSFAHCVGHGLLMRADILNSVGYFPSPRIGLEDSGLGFVLKSKKISIAPFPMLESAEVPSNIISLAVQKSRWFFGPISAPYYMDAALKAGGSRFISYISLFEKIFFEYNRKM